MESFPRYIMEEYACAEAAGICVRCRRPSVKVECTRCTWVMRARLSWHKVRWWVEDHWFWVLALLLFAAADFVRIEGLQHPAVQWVLQAVRRCRPSSCSLRSSWGSRPLEPITSGASGVVPQ